MGCDQLNDTPPELEAWMEAHHDPKWKPTKTRRITLPRRMRNRG